jgi:hypothetical protein
MKESELNKRQLSDFGRTFTLLFNRGFMYSANHPYLIEAINSAYNTLEQLLQTISPVVFILNRDRFYVDEEPLDPRLSVSRIAAHFKKTSIESISFYQGIEKKDFRLFLEIATSLDKYADAEAMNKAIFKKRINRIKINHVFYKKVSAEDEVISRDVLKKVTPEMTGEHQDKIKQMFIDSVFDSVLMEEFVKTLNLKNLLKSPGDLSKEMIAMDLTTVKQNEDKGQRPGQFLLHQLEVIDDDVERSLSKEGELDLPDLASALFDMRQKLAEGLEAQKALGIAYSNEEQILSKSTEITDKVLIKLLKEEYKGGDISVSRLAQILCRLIPEANELKRLLPMIKSALVEEGISQADFIELVQELGKELQSDGLVGILAESAEEIGIDGEDIIQQVKENPLHSAELIYLASELRKGGGDEKALTDLLVNYVERIGSQISLDIPHKEGENGEKHLQRVMAEVKSSLVRHIGNMDIKEDLLTRLEERLNQRMDEVLDKLRLEWLNSHSSTSEPEFHRELTVLETLEQGVCEDEDLKEILKIIRKKVESQKLDENDFDQIYSEIVKQDQLQKSENEKRGLSSGIMRDQMLMTFVDKEIARAKRYETPLSALGFTLVKARVKTNSQTGQIRNQDVINALLDQLAEIFRNSDIIGEFRKNQLIVLLPMTHRGKARVALRRAMKILHLNPIDFYGITLEIKAAGVVADIDLRDAANASSLVDHLSAQLTEMATRIGNLHAYS